MFNLEKANAEIVNYPSTQRSLIREHPLDRDPGDMFLLTQRSKVGRDSQASSLKSLAEVITGEPDWRMVAWENLDYGLCQRICEALLAGKTWMPCVRKPGTPPLEPRSWISVNKILTALRGTLKQCWKMDLIDSERYTRAKSIESLRGTTSLAGRAISPSEITRMLGCCSDGPHGTLERALIATLYFTGARCAEAVAFTVDNFNAKDFSLTILHGKGNKARKVYIGDETAQQIFLDWLKLRDQWAEMMGDIIPRKDKDIFKQTGPLFMALIGNDRLSGNHLRTGTVLSIIKKTGKKAGLGNVSPHDLRRGFITYLIDAGGDIITVGRLAGHNSPLSTEKYDRRPESTKRKTAKLLRLDRKDTEED
jgi:integrase